MSLVAWNQHYIRDGEGRELLFDMLQDPSERNNLAEAPDSRPMIEAFRTKLLELLAENPGSTAVERAYLQDYRRTLQELVRERAPQRLTHGPRPGPDRSGPGRRPTS